jgi:hypothetical protein
MRCDLSIVAADFDAIKENLKQLLQDFENGNVHSNCFRTDKTGDVDYTFTDCDEVFVDNSECRVINPKK